MKSPLTKIAAGAVASIALMAGAAQAESYDFKYTFDTGQVITGTFTGTGPLTDITNIGNIHAQIDGVQLTGLAAYSYTSPPPAANCGLASCFALGGATVSSIPGDNNFVFADTNIGAPTTTKNYFYIIPWSNGPGNQTATQALLPDGTSIDPYNGGFKPENWSVTVPEPAAWALMLAGFAGLGAAMRAARRRTLATA